MSMTFRSIQGHHRSIGWLQTAVRTHHLGHAYLFQGEGEIGKRLVAMAFSKFLHCESPLEPPFEDACGKCRSCHQVELHAHPDFLLIEPEDGQKQSPKIKIDQIRHLEHFVIYRPLVSSHKICLIDQADTMTVEAANALLKTLEDPPDHCLFLLISSRPEHLLPTIRSRCMTLRFAPLSLTETYDFLTEQNGMEPSDARLLAAYSEGRIGMALRLTPEELHIQLRQYWALLFHDFPKAPSTILDICEDLGKSDHMLEALRWFRLGLRELLLMTLDPKHAPVFFTKQTGDLHRLSRHLSPSIPLELLENLEQLERGQQRNANMQLGLEQFFFLLQEKMGMGIAQNASCRTAHAP